jgi:hypothetical protein
MRVCVNTIFARTDACIWSALTVCEKFAFFKFIIPLHACMCVNSCTHECNHMYNIQAYTMFSGQSSAISYVCVDNHKYECIFDVYIHGWSVLYTS